MNRMRYRKIENYMLSQMGDSAHDTEHIYAFYIRAGYYKA